MENELIISKFSILPIDLQSQVFDYIDFLVSKYKDRVLLEKEELPNYIKEELDKSKAAYLQNPQKVKSFEQIEKEIIAEHGYNL